MNYPKSINDLIDCFKDLPGVGEKTAERMALSTLDFEKEKLDYFAKSFIDVKTKIRRCKTCNNISENELCEICKDKSRDNQRLCIVEDIRSIILFEKNKIFSGKYHVFDKLISPIEGIGPDDIDINKLLERIKNEEIKEIIIAIKPSLEGETTAMYIKKCLENNSTVIVSKIAQGIPMGAAMEYIDPLTLETAFYNRKEI
ncbi:MAG: recombination mediator RecR [Bacilli bacterium]|jgi:recombination protein RecR|nr:recombination protein RecR [Mollicutes bacterium]